MHKAPDLTHARKIDATVIRVNSGGLVFAEDDAHTIYSFRFSQIYGYRGESAAEMRLKARVAIHLFTRSDRIVCAELPMFSTLIASKVASA